MYTRQMMKARARSILARDVYPDVLAGCYDADSDELSRAPVSTLREPDAVDAEIVEPGTGLGQEINSAATHDELSALAPKINKLTKGSPERVNAMAAFKARQVFLAEAPKAEAATAP
jgi:hypothetical protein